MYIYKSCINKDILYKQLSFLFLFFLSNELNLKAEGIIFIMKGYIREIPKLIKVFSIR